MNKELKHIISEIKRVAKQEDILPSEVTKSKLLSNSELKEWDLRKFGGLSSIIKANFPIENKSLGDIASLKEAQSYISKLEKRVGLKEKFEQEVKDIFSEKLKPLPKIKLINPKKQKTKRKRDLVMMLNDTHFGLKVEPEEVNGVNKFDWTEACRRVAMVLAETIDFKPHTRDEVETVHLVLAGDLQSGLIHGLNTKGIELYVHQMNGTVHILTYVISHLLANFKNVKIHGISGNHSDAVHKREHGKRVVSEKYDSYENTCFYALSAIFKDNNRATFNYPKTPYAFMDLAGGRAMIAHGDVLFSKQLGNPGSNINVKGLSEEIRKFNTSEIAMGRDPVKLVLFGHTHCMAHFITSDGVEVYNAPSLSGVDGYAHSLNINNNFIGQLVFESTKDFILGDHRLVRVNKADTNSELDKLIPIFGKELAWKK